MPQIQKTVSDFKDEVSKMVENNKTDILEMVNKQIKFRIKIERK